MLLEKKKRSDGRKSGRKISKIEIYKSIKIESKYNN